VEQLRSEIAKKVGSALGISPDVVLSALEAPKNPTHGDVALPCFKLAKPLGREGKDAPAKIAQELVSKVEKGELLASVQAAGPFVNFKLAPGALAATVLKQIAAPGRFGGSTEGKGKKIVIDYSSPNIAKPFHLGHLRSTVLGHAIRKLHESLGYEVVGINHLGDWGTQFGFMLAAWKRWQKDAEARIQKGEGEIDVFVSLYVRISQLAKEDPSVRDEARSWFRRLEQGDQEARQLWRYFVDRSKKEFDRIYAILGIRHESDAGESFYEDKMQPVIERVRARGLLVCGERAHNVDEDALDSPGVASARPMGVQLGDPDRGGLGFPLLLKSDGGTTYATRDLAAAYYRETTYHPERIVYVVGAPQILHFRQLKKILELMGEPWHEKLVHVPFGQYVGMSTREGNVVFLDEVLLKARDKAIEAAESATKKQALTEAEIAENARKIGAGAVKFFDLKNGRMKDIQLEKDEKGKIDLDRILATKGETGPYVQFAYARLSGVLRNFGKEPTTEGVDFSLLHEPEAMKVVKAIGEHPQKVRQALADFEPSIIARHLLDVADAVHSFLHVHRIMDSEKEKVDPNVRAARALLVSCSRKVVGQCLDLLGIEPLEKM